MTDQTQANARLFVDLVGRCWARDLFEDFALDRSLFPPALEPWTVAAELPRRVAGLLGLRSGIPVVLGGGDSQCAAFGDGVVEPGPISEMAGSSSCINSAVLTPLGDERITHYSHVVPAASRPSSDSTRPAPRSRGRWSRSATTARAVGGFTASTNSPRRLRPAAAGS